MLLVFVLGSVYGLIVDRVLVCEALRVIVWPPLWLRVIAVLGVLGMV